MTSIFCKSHGSFKDPVDMTRMFKSGPRAEVASNMNGASSSSLMHAWQLETFMQCCND